MNRFDFAANAISFARKATNCARSAISFARNSLNYAVNSDGSLGDLLPPDQQIDEDCDGFVAQEDAGRAIEEAERLSPEPSQVPPPPPPQRSRVGSGDREVTKRVRGGSAFDSNIRSQTVTVRFGNLKTEVFDYTANAMTSGHYNLGIRCARDL